MYHPQLEQQISQFLCKKVMLYTIFMSFLSWIHDRKAEIRGQPVLRHLGPSPSACFGSNAGFESSLVTKVLLKKQLNMYIIYAPYLIRFVYYIYPSIRWYNDRWWKGDIIRLNNYDEKALFTPLFQKHLSRYSWAFFETRFQKSGPLRFFCHIRTLNDLKMLSIIMLYEVIMDFDVFSHSKCFSLR